MSKSRGNALDAHTRNSSAETLGTLWNIFSFYKTYAELDDWTPQGNTHRRGQNVLDKWILSELDDTVATVTHSLEHFDSYAAARRLMGFIDDLSNWYLRRSRPRYWKGQDEDAFGVLHECLLTTATLLAPFWPHALGSTLRGTHGRIVSPPR